MKLKWKPWQLILSAVAGVAVVGGAATGIWYGIDRAIDNKIDSRVEEQVDSVMETATAEQALDEPTATAAESTEEETETTTEKEPDTVIVYVVPSEPESQSENDDWIRPDEIEPKTMIVG